MKVKINDTEVTFPSQLPDITLGQRIRFHNSYGRELDEQLKSISEMEEGPMKELEFTMWQVDNACKTFAFFSGIELTVVQESESLFDIMQVYNAMKALLSDESEQEGKTRFEWKDAVWVLHPPELKTTSTMTFGEFADSKQIVQDLHDLSAGNWEALIRLCAIYLRKEGEAYDKGFAEEDSDRCKLMEELPMDIALSVGFFLSSSMSLFLEHLLSLKNPQPEVEGTSGVTSNNGGGSTS